MSSSHKAYAFAWQDFHSELAPILFRDLGTSDAASLRDFVNGNLGSCADPYEGKPLDPSWESHLKSGDVHEVGAFALTRYYTPADDFGLAQHWLAIDMAAPERARKALLGTSFGPSGSSFDPGRMGSYFQTEIQVARSLLVLQALGVSELAGFLRGLSRAVASGTGLYVTF